MNETALVVVTALCSGLIATLVTIWWQNKAQTQNEKMILFKTLMSKRYEIHADESVDALNMIDVVFYKSPKVRAAWKSFNDATNAQESSTRDQTIADKHLKLLEVIAEDIGYKDIRWDDIKQYYYPVGMSNRKQDEAILRRVQIDAGIAQIKDKREQENVAQINSKTVLEQQLVEKMLDNPEGFARLIEMADKVQNTKRTNKPRK